MPKADHPTRTRTRTRTRTLWGGQCFDAVACEGSRLIRPARLPLSQSERVYGYPKKIRYQHATATDLPCHEKTARKNTATKAKETASIALSSREERGTILFL